MSDYPRRPPLPRWMLLLRAMIEHEQHHCAERCELFRLLDEIEGQQG